MSLKSFAALSLLLMSAGTQAAADAGSLRPKARPAVQVHGVHLRELLVTPVSLRPQARPAGWAARPTAAAPAATAEDARLQGWIAGYRRRALAAGIPAQVFDRAFRGVTYDPQIIARDRSQTEFTKTVEQYLAIAASDKRIADGRAALAAEGAYSGPDRGALRGRPRYRHRDLGAGKRLWHAARRSFGDPVAGHPGL